MLFEGTKDSTTLHNTLLVVIYARKGALSIAVVVFGDEMANVIQTHAPPSEASGRGAPKQVYVANTRKSTALAWQEKVVCEALSVVLLMFRLYRSLLVALRRLPSWRRLVRRLLADWRSYSARWSPPRKLPRGALSTRTSRRHWLAANVKYSYVLSFTRHTSMWCRYRARAAAARIAADVAFDAAETLCFNNSSQIVHAYHH